MHKIIVPVGSDFLYTSGMLQNEVEQFERYLAGVETEAYRLFGAHFVKQDGVDGVLFRLYAPNAKSVDVVGSFDVYPRPMTRADWRGVFELFIPGLCQYDSYKYRIEGCDGITRFKADPFAFFSDLRPASDSRLFDLNGFAWHDDDYVNHRTRRFDEPMSIYEVYLPSWQRHGSGRILSYEEVADQLIPYVQGLGFTHVEFMPICQYPFDGSWGYQATGFYSADSRQGNPKQLMSLVDRLHQAGIGVILDFAPTHFATDDYGLARFDGTPMYEYGDGLSPWGSYLFDLGKDPVRSFLISAINMYISLFHFDGIRIDAVSNAIFYEGNKMKGTNDGGVEFLKRMNGLLHAAHPNLFTIAEDSSDYPGVTHRDGLGFDYKWDLGWMNDTLRYYSRDPIYKKYHHNEITFSMAYYFSERFLMPLSHDEVVHLKHSLLSKMPGSYEDKFALLKNLLFYQFAHPGKRLLFMGSEIAPFEEWDETKELPWQYGNFPAHDSVRAFLAELNKIEQNEPGLRRGDYDPNGTEWMMVDNADDSVFAFVRRNGNDTYLAVLNMTPVDHWDYKVGAPAGQYLKIIDSSFERFGGHEPENHPVLYTTPGAPEGHPDGLTIHLPGFAAVLYKKVG